MEHSIEKKDRSFEMSEKTVLLDIIIEHYSVIQLKITNAVNKTLICI